MTWFILALVAVSLALIPMSMFLTNLPLFQQSLGNDASSSDPADTVSVLIPARDEAAAIEQCVRCVLANRKVDLEVLVLDDHSSDDTARIVQRLATTDRRVRLLAGQPLPVGWNGKQYACYQLALAASHDRIVWIDADVRLDEDALWKLMQYQDRKQVSLLSLFPHQHTGSWLEHLLIPLMHYVLLGFLPFRRMRTDRSPAYAAGCGQFFMTRQRDYQTAGGHEAIQLSRHDGLKLPRAFRQAGLETDVIDGTLLAQCRMYHGTQQVVRGILKNADEGIANVRLIVPFSILLLGANVLPWVTLGEGVISWRPITIVVSLLAVLIAHLPRAIAAIRFRQHWIGVPLHSVAIVVFIALQWIALVMHLMGRQVAWRGRQDLPAQ